MLTDSQKSHSLWQHSLPPEYPALSKDISVDTCIIGAGITGLTTAYRLLKEGQTVAVIDRDRIGVHESGLTTAHISNALDEYYFKLERYHGKEKNKLIYQSHTEAIDMIEKIVNTENIECDFERVSGYLIGAGQDDPQFLNRELAAAKAAGFIDAEIVTDLHFGAAWVKKCLKFPHQAQFHALKYLSGLAKAVRKMGGQIYTESTVTNIAGGMPARVTVHNGRYILCDHVVVATHVPINTRVAVHTKQAAYRTYVIGLRVPKTDFKKALLWDAEDPYHYVRLYEDPESVTHDILLIGGEDHRTGQEEDPEFKYLSLQTWAQEFFNIESNLVYSWSGQIIEPVDGIGYIGLSPGFDKNIFVATGYSGHGITHGTLAASLLTDLILRRPNIFAELYDPGRIGFSSLANYAGENINTAAQYIDWLAPGDPRKDLKKEEGRVCRQGLTKVAIYKDINEEVHEFSALCPHLGGVISWNESEKTWDCPCHGSRFSAMGQVLNGPANRDLDRTESIKLEDFEPTTDQPRPMIIDEQILSGGI